MNIHSSGVRIFFHLNIIPKKSVASQHLTQ